MRWPSAGDDPQHADQAARAVTIALCLMLGMLILDLTWTILAGQAGVMKEVNPIAAEMIDSPLQLAVFKIVTTSIGLGILYFWRNRHQIQFATWWVCLVCVLLTFRWVVFDSVIS